MADSTFDALWKARGGPRELLLDYYGVSVSYTPRGGVAKSITADVDYGESGRDSDENGELDTSRLSLVISTDATAGIASPGVGDTVEVDGETYVVVRVLDKNGGMATVECERSDRFEHSRPGFRGEV